MATWTLISCSKSKQTEPAFAEQLYTSPLFRKSLLSAISGSGPYAILSAKHGLLAPDTVVAPYDVTLNTMDIASRNDWGKRVADQLREKLKSGDQIVFLTGEEYRRPIETNLGKYSFSFASPLKGKALGQRLQFLSRQNDEQELFKLHKQFYEIMWELLKLQEGGRKLSDATGRLEWPRRGVYFFLEDSERTLRRFRISRIGTHAVSRGSQTTLWDRLSTHRGVSAGGGSHRSSIFRLHVGRALMRAGSHESIPSWGIGSVGSKTEREFERTLERTVSETIGRMRVVWLDIPDDAGPFSDRAYVEKASIGLLSRAHILNPSKSKQWLGNHSPELRISSSGLWNLNYVYSRPDPSLITVLQRYVDALKGHASLPHSPIAPPGWHKQQAAADIPQLDLFRSEDSSTD